MVDLSAALDAIRSMDAHNRSRTSAVPNPTSLGTCWGQHNPLKSCDVPSVPNVPDATSIVERAAVLEHCEGLARSEADRIALAERDLESWEALALRLSEQMEVELGTSDGGYS